MTFLMTALICWPLMAGQVSPDPECRLEVRRVSYATGWECNYWLNQTRLWVEQQGGRLMLGLCDGYG